MQSSYLCPPKCPPPTDLAGAALLEGIEILLDGAVLLDTGACLGIGDGVEICLCLTGACLICDGVVEILLLLSTGLLCCIVLLLSIGCACMLRLLSTGLLSMLFLSIGLGAFIPS